MSLKEEVEYLRAANKELMGIVRHVRRLHRQTEQKLEEQTRITLSYVRRLRELQSTTAIDRKLGKKGQCQKHVEVNREGADVDRHRCQLDSGHGGRCR